MNVGNERTKSLWMQTRVAPDAERLRGNERCDTLIVGAGIAGLSCAYELASAGHAVIVIDRGAIGGGMTSRTTAHLAPGCDDLTSALDELKGAVHCTGRESRRSSSQRQEAKGGCVKVERGGNAQCSSKLSSFEMTGDHMNPPS